MKENEKGKDLNEREREIQEYVQGMGGIKKSSARL